MIAPPRWLYKGGGDYGPAPFLVAAIVNVTPDSFSDGGLYAAPDDALARCRRVLDEGAHMLDIGAESTRPGSDAVTPAEELARLKAVLPEAVALCATRGDAARPTVFVDTWRAATAAAVLDMGADGINDISGASFEPEMADVLAQYKPGYVLMHTPAPPKTMQAHTQYGNVVDDVLAFFERQMAHLAAAGLPEDRIALDPGIGFGKTPEQNMELLRNTARLHTLGRPLYIGISRKRFLGQLVNAPLAERDTPTQVLTALLAAQGAYVHRVHDVPGAVKALRLTELMA